MKVKAADLEKLSIKATPGPWVVFDQNGVIEIQAAKQEAVIAWTGFDASPYSDAINRVNANLVTKLVNAYREGNLIFKIKD